MFHVFVYSVPCDCYLSFSWLLCFTFLLVIAGKLESIWEIEELRSKSGKQHTVPTAFACVKVQPCSSYALFPIFIMQIHLR